MRNLLLIVLACGCSTEAPLSYSVDTLPSGTIEIVNHAPNRWADTTGWKIVLQVEHTFPLDTDGAIDYPNYPHRLANGEFIVLNQVPPFVQRYAADFTPLGKFGRDGTGPGEFTNPGLYALGDTIAVLEEGRSLLMLFSSEGELLREDQLPLMTDWIGVRDNRGLLPLMGRYRARSDAGVMWWSVERGEVVDSIHGPEEPPQIIWSACAFVPPYQASLDLAATPSGQAWYGITDADRFVLTNSGSDSIVVSHTPDRPRFAVPQERVNELLKPDGFIAQRCGPAARRSDIPADQPAWRSLRVDGPGNLWVSRPAAYGGSYDVYDAGGIWLGEVPSPFRRGENVYWQGDIANSVEMLEEGGYTWRRYGIARQSP